MRPVLPAFGPCLVLAMACLASAARAAPLADLAVLPVKIIPTTLLESGGGKVYGLYADVNDGSPQAVTGTAEVRLAAQPSVHPMPGHARFVLRIHARDTVQADLRVNLIATNKRCMLTTIDPTLTQGSQAGRQIEVTPVLTFLDGVRFPRTGDTYSICTADSGQMVLYFASPSFDMVQMTAISIDAAGYSAAVYLLMLPLPTSKLAEQAP